tara:strand:+ start:119 stop:1057 length:939 start_codon:yes stop_codon:yes gene_type:complete
MKDPKENLKGLINYRESLGVPIYKEFSISNEITLIDPIKAQLEEIEGVVVKDSEVEQFLDGSLLAYKGQLAILYITDTHKTEEYLKDNNLVRTGKNSREEEKGPKFHFSWCRTLEQKKRDGSFEARYVMLRNKSGKFIVQAKDEITKESYKLDEPVKLFVCKNCLEGALGINTENKFGYKGYSKNWSKEEKREAVNNFNIQAYLDENESVLNDIKYKTKYEDRTAPTNNYTSEWKEISRKLREKHSWKCTSCWVNLSKKKTLLHTHHRDHDKTNNSPSNLEVICALCHKEKHHPRMHVSYIDEQYIKKHRPK